MTGYKSLRLTHETLDINPTFHELPIHDDCVPAGVCSAHLQIRMYLTLDYIPNGQFINFLKDDKRRMDPARGYSSTEQIQSRLIPVPELYPGDILMWDMTKLHTAMSSKRRVLTWSTMSGEESLEPGVGMVWLGLYDRFLWREQDSVYYPIIYPSISDKVTKAREGFSGVPPLVDTISYSRAYLNRRSMFFTSYNQTAGVRKSTTSIVDFLDMILPQSNA